MEIEASLDNLPNSYPIYKKPENFIKVDLRDFGYKFKENSITGEVINNKLYPLPTRAEINKGHYKGKEMEIAWALDEIDAFFLQIQGSGVLKLADGSKVKIGFSGSNGHDYSSIGKILIDKGYLKKENLSMHSIMNWLKNNPKLARLVMEENKRFIFFKFNNDGPIGSAGTKLYPNISVAIDPKYYPIGIPLIIKYRNRNDMPKIYLAQDKGNAIKGTGRIDLFLGNGIQAENKASKLAEEIEIWALIPKEFMINFKDQFIKNLYQTIY